VSYASVRREWGQLITSIERLSGVSENVPSVPGSPPTSSPQKTILARQSIPSNKLARTTPNRGKPLSPQPDRIPTAIRISIAALHCSMGKEAPEPASSAIIGARKIIILRKVLDIEVMQAMFRQCGIVLRNKFIHPRKAKRSKDIIAGTSKIWNAI
jgi:hypothetical protein